MNYAPAPAPAPKQVTVGGAPVPIQNNIVVNGKTYRGVCAFFNTPRGCNWGDKCGYLHQAGINP
jgi:protein phosphatase 1 regulatory subunit 10